MKRSVAGAVLLAGLGGGCAGTRSTTGVVDGAAPFGQATGAQVAPGLKGPQNEPVHVTTAAGQMPTDGVTRADGRRGPGNLLGGVSQTAGFAQVSSRSGAGAGGAGCAVPGVGCGPAGGAGGMGYGLPAGGPTTSGFRNALGHGGITPVPAFGPAGAVAAIGAYGAAGGPGSGMYGGLYMNGRTSIRFTNPAGMKIGWQTAAGVFSDAGLEAPARYNFPQMSMYRLRLSGIPNRPGRQFYPTLEIYPATMQTVTYLSHATVPVTFTDEDFEQASAGSLVTKVVYLPSERFQDLAAVAGGAEEIVSTRLEPGIDPVAEANKRGTILAVIRFGNIDLQDPNTPAPDAPTPGGMGLPPGAMMAPPGTTPTTTAPGAAPMPKPPATLPSMTVPSMTVPPTTTPSVTPPVNTFRPPANGRPVSLPPTLR